MVEGNSDDNVLCRLTPCKDNLECRITHNANGSMTLPCERTASSASRPLEEDDEKEKTIKTTKEKGGQQRPIFTHIEGGGSEQRRTSKCREAGMRMSGEDAVPVSVTQEVPFAGLSVGLLRSLRWVRSVGALVGQKRLLLGVSWSAGTLALLLLFCAIAMDSWLFTVEREPDETSNATFLITLHSGLWRVCKKNLFMKDVGKNTQWNLSWRSLLPLETHTTEAALFTHQSYYLRSAVGAEKWAKQFEQEDVRLHAHDKHQWSMITTSKIAHPYLTFNSEARKPANSSPQRASSLGVRVLRDGGGSGGLRHLKIFRGFFSEQNKAVFYSSSDRTRLSTHTSLAS
ncbi:hypothetical protein EGR_02343 [Echinococcus granulosus]|uniref:Uncharacterized protein n=1 Tax=Echinococcus granulosus TaxID=6210 RepID=W6UWN8_ECHGR|nr:hypothetical protein EGR_02343 [Echinococcus granulosus]EUB62902.1 hypothetical protein EGR_02343 [Echinococcus granulosus]